MKIKLELEIIGDNKTLRAIKKGLLNRAIEKHFFIFEKEKVKINLTEVIKW